MEFPEHTCSKPEGSNVNIRSRRPGVYCDRGPKVYYENDIMLDPSYLSTRGVPISDL